MKSLNTAWCTYDVVVLAAHNVGLAVAASDTDDADGRAVEAQDNVEALHNNPEQTQEQAAGAGVGLQSQPGLDVSTHCYRKSDLHSQESCSIGWGR